MKKLKRLLRMRGNDPKIVVLIAPVFALATAVNVMTISFSKALFLASNPYDALPWMFIGAGFFATILTLFYVTTIERWDSTVRVRYLFGIAGLSYLLIGIGIVAGLGVDEQLPSLLVYMWCSGVSPLLIVQTWSWSSKLLDVRLARRLFPIMSALATIGAAAGGALTRGVVQTLGLAVLVSLAALLAFLSGYFANRASRLVPVLVPQDTGMMPVPNEEKKKKRSPIGQLPEAVGVLLKIPLLGRLALLAFVVQAASVVLDFQFSSALKAGFESKDEMASFLGAYFFGANVLTLVIALFAAGRITKWLGIGMASSSAALVLLVGGVCAVALGWFEVPAELGGLTPVFWAVVATSFVERIAGFGVAKQAMQAAQMPVPPKYLESTRFLISGVMTRLAVVGVSVGILIWGSDLQNYESLSPLLVVLSAIAIIIGIGLGSRYRRALLEMLTDNVSRLSKVIPDWARDEAVRVVAQMLVSQRSDQIKTGLALCRDLGSAPPERVVDRLLRDADDAVVLNTLEGLHGGFDDGQKAPIRQSTLQRLLKPDRPPEIIAGALALVPEEWTTFEPEVTALLDYPDESVSSRAVVWLRGGVLGPQTRQAIRKRIQDQTSDEVTFEDTHDDEGVDQDALLLGEERQLGALTRQFVQLVDRLPELLRSDSPKLQRVALDLFVELSLPEHVHTLVQALEAGPTRPVAMVALGRMPPEVVLPVLQEQLKSERSTDRHDPSEAARRIWVLKAVERIGGERCVSMLIEHLETKVRGERHQVVTSLWTMSRDESVRHRLPAEAIKARVMRELEELCTVAVLDGLLEARQGENVALLRLELATSKSRGEFRAFRLLALLYGRESIDRAYDNYRHPDRRQRSNALELLDATISDSDLRQFIAYVESTDSQGSRSNASGTQMGQLPAFMRVMRRLRDALGGDPIASLLADHDRWIYELYTWANRLDGEDFKPDTRGSVEEPTHEEVMQRLFLLKGVDLFQAVSADQLLPLAHVARRQRYSAGDLIFEEGAAGYELFVVADGTVAVEKGGKPVASVGSRGAFGEMAILDEAPRSAAVRAKTDVECLVIARDDFYDVFDIAPGLARGAIRVLVRRARENMDEKSQ